MTNLVFLNKKKTFQVEKKSEPSINFHHGLCEAAQVKDLVPILYDVACGLLNANVEYECLVLEVMRASCQIDQALESSVGSWLLTGKHLQAFRGGVQELNLILTELGLRSHQVAALFNYTIKNHALEHISLQASLLSPRLTWCYPQESFLQHVRRLVQSCRMQPSLKLQGVTMCRYLRTFEAATIGVGVS